ncbi:hypothetical protein J7T55_011185 [Diaporthe amygdali]|uniref:uncharacterized protein n=1 Tax=Phomopsis amygdali TaxID=1214568 RepID=UPI0022FDFBB3|nr:uncharacterized protein J7T55_011185 [Diaporthe amygdali]KAJ0100671.1 hypothetical protein J7T55_011185 [Diaporthe amygdali]
MRPRVPLAFEFIVNTSIKLPDTTAISHQLICLLLELDGPVRLVASSQPPHPTNNTYTTTLELVQFLARQITSVGSLRSVLNGTGQSWPQEQQPRSPVVDIVAVHGLNGHREKTWTAPKGVHWLRDLLPADIPHARIMCWGYDANTHDSSRVSCQYLYDHARSLVSDLCRKRTLTYSSRPQIIFIAHSLGGIIVKNALIHSDAARRNALVEHQSVRLSTFGIIFMGTTHQCGNGVQLTLKIAFLAGAAV